MFSSFAKIRNAAGCGGGAAAVRVAPASIRANDCVTIDAPLETSNGRGTNHTIMTGTRLVVVEDGGVMFGDGGYVRVSMAESPEGGDWVRVSELKRSAHKVLPPSARVRVAVGAHAGKLATVVRERSDFGVDVRFDGSTGVNVLSQSAADGLALIGGPLEYTSEGGSKVGIPAEIQPWAELGLAVGADRHAVRAARVALAADEPSRQRRALLSLCGNALGSLETDYFHRHPGGVVTFNRQHPMVLAAAGAVGKHSGGTMSIKSMLVRDERSRKYVTEEDKHGECMLYKAARSGFYDLVNTLLDTEGVEVDQTQRSGSSALHAACFYGQAAVAQLLVVRGANPGLKNRFGNTPLAEAHHTLRARVEVALGVSDAPTVFRQAIDSGIGHGRVREIVHGGNVVARKLCRVDAAGDVMPAPRGYEIAWHGTQAKCMLSILTHGLRASGSTLPGGGRLVPPPNHYALGHEHQGISDWAAAIFVSPSVMYASHACYAERVMEHGKLWAVVVNCAVRPSSFTRHDQTTGGYTPLPGEPEEPEYRVEVEDDCDSQILRVQGNDNVVVTGCTFIDICFLERCKMTFGQIRDLLTA
jgi:hypothetical protein